MLISVVGTLLTDNLTDALGVPLVAQHRRCSRSPLALTFAIWYAAERTLSIHSIVTRRREAFYWLAVLFTFALGTAAGDLVSEQFGCRLLADRAARGADHRGDRGQPPGLPAPTPC